MKGIFRIPWKFCCKHSTKILAGMAIMTEVLGFWFMHKEAPIVRDRLEALGDGAGRLDKIKTAAPIYLPALLMLLTSCGCIACGYVANESKIAAITSLYATSEAALTKQLKRAIDKMGPEKSKEMHDEALQEVMKERPVTNSTVYATGRGDVLFYEPLIGRYFTSDPNEVIAAMNRANHRIVCELEITVNEWLSELGIEDVELGNMSGWNVDNLINIPDDPRSFPAMTASDGRPCLIVEHFNKPRFIR